MNKKQFKTAFVCLFIFFLSTSKLHAQLFGDLGEKTNDPLLSLSAAISGAGYYDSNIFKTSFNETDDFYLGLQPQVILQMRYSNFSLNLAYQPRFLFLTQDEGADDLDKILQDLKFSTVLYKSEYFKFQLDDTLNSTQTFYQGPETPDNVSLRNRLNPKGIFTYAFDPLTAVELVAEFERTDIEFPGEDFYGFGGNGTLTRDLFQYLGILGGGGAHQNIYDSAWVGNNTSVNAQGGIYFDLFDRVSGKATVQYDWLFLPYSQVARNLGFDAELTSQLTELTTFTLTGEHRLGMDLTAHVVKNTTVRGTLNHQLGPRTTFETEGYFSILDIPTFSPFLDRIWGVRAALLYEITENIRSEVRYEFDQNIGPTYFNDFDDHRAILSLTYDFGTLINIY